MPSPDILCLLTATTPVSVLVPASLPPSRTRAHTQLDEARRAARDESELQLEKMRNEGRQASKRALTQQREAAEIALERAKQLLIRELESAREAKLQAAQSSAQLEHEKALSALRHRIEEETSKATTKIIEGLAAEATEHTRLHRAQVEAELQAAHHERVQTLREEAAGALLKDEALVRTQTLTRHKEAEVALSNELQERREVRLKELRTELKEHGEETLRSARKAASRQMRKSERTLASEFNDKMERELLSLSAHHMSERDDMAARLGTQMETTLASLKDASVKQFHDDLDQMRRRFDNDCAHARSLMNSLFGGMAGGMVVAATAVSGRGSGDGGSGSGSQYVAATPVSRPPSAAATASTRAALAVHQSQDQADLSRIQKEYANMHAIQVKTALRLAEVAKEAAKLRHELRESKRGHLLQARARAAIPSLLKRSDIPTLAQERAARSLVRSNRRLVNKLQHMQSRYTELEDSVIKMSRGTMMADPDMDFSGISHISRSRRSSRRRRGNGSSGSRKRGSRRRERDSGGSDDDGDGDHDDNDGDDRGVSQQGVGAVLSLSSESFSGDD